MGFTGLGFGGGGGGRIEGFTWKPATRYRAGMALVAVATIAYARGGSGYLALVDCEFEDVPCIY